MEVWYNQKNNKFMEELVGELGKEVEGVPCLIIGDQVFFGYTESMGTEIKKQSKMNIYLWINTMFIKIINNQGSMMKVMLFYVIIS